MPNQDQHAVLLEHIKPSDRRRALGVRLAGDGSNKQEKEFLYHKCRAWATKITAANIARNLAWLTFYSTIYRIISYLLVATTFTKADTVHTNYKV